MTQPKGDPNEPNFSFRDADIKVRWAEKQIDDLEGAIKRTLDRYSETGGCGYDAQAGIGYVTNLAMHPFHACLAGDIIFSLRSALDCCWMGLRRAISASASKGTLPRGTANQVKSTIKEATVERAFPGVQRFLLDELKAYEGGNELLWFIAQADNWNKHNMLMVVAQRTSVGSAILMFPDGLRVELENASFQGFAGGPFFSAPTSGAPKWENQSNVSFDILLKIGKPIDERHLMPFLRAALVDTRKGVDDFVRLFGKVVSNSASPA